VNIPASIDSAKAAVGFFSTFTANVHPYNYAPCRNYQSTVTLTCEEREPSMLCRSIGRAKHVHSKAFCVRFPVCLAGDLLDSRVRIRMLILFQETYFFAIPRTLDTL
jgi:hypothetical protein